MAGESHQFMELAKPVPGVQYPLKVTYCPPDICDGWPVEYCEFHPAYDKAKEWIEKNLSDEMKDMYLAARDDIRDSVNNTRFFAIGSQRNFISRNERVKDFWYGFRLFIFGDNEEEGAEGGEKKKRQTRGGRGVIKTKTKQEVEKHITLARASRGKKKYITIVTGLTTYEIDLKVASKAFGAKFACGSSVTGEDEIVIQGDVKDDLYDFLTEKWPQIDEDTIDDLGDQKRSS